MRPVFAGSAAGLLLTALAAAPVAAQIAIGQDVSRYELLYGQPVDVALDDLVLESSSYQDRAIRTKGRLDFGSDQTGRTYSLRSTFGNRVQLYPVSEVAGFFEQEAPSMLGRQVEVTGVFRGGSGGGGTQAFAIEFWAFLGPEQDTNKPIKATTVSLEELVTHPGKQDGRVVRVVGKFRGRNLYGDLPSKSQLASSDWVIKDDLFAVWVTGKKPRGSGWALDASLKRDTGRWLEVVGSVETRRGVVYLHAKTLALTEPPKASAEALPPPPPKERPKLPPALVFSLPLDGESDVPRDTRFVVQFSKDMDENSFSGHVGLRYTGPRRPGDRDFDGMKLSYDGGLRALTVDPGDLLRPGREVEVVLLAGILDIDGLELVPRSGRPRGNVVDVLRYSTVPY
jgi:Bacterial Ig-like domain